MSDPVLYNHRGTNPYVDNSIESYRWGYNYGGDYSETDFRLTKDGIVISYHDDLPGGIANLTYVEIKALVPTIVTLGELIELTKQMETDTGRKLGILIENKAADYATAEAIVQTLVAHDFADPERIVYQTFGGDLPYVRNTLFSQYGVEFPLVQLTGSTLTSATIAYYATYADGVAPTMASLTPELVAEAHAAGLTVNGWTVEGTLADVRHALDLGVDGIINDNTQLARPALEQILRDATVVYGDEQANEVNGSTGTDVLYGMAGDDIVRGGLGNDTLYGDGGNDVLFGGAGDDQLTGGSGRDYLDGGAGSDVLSGGVGNDIIVATGDTVIFRAGDGIDLVSLDAASTIVFEGFNTANASVIRDGDNIIIRSGSDALVLLDGVDPAHQPASVSDGKGLTLSGAELVALAVAGSDAEVAAVLPELLAVLDGAPDLAVPSSVSVGTDLVAETGFEEGTLFYPIQSVETGAAYRLSFSLADLPTGDDGVRVLWGGAVVYEGIPSATGDNLHFMLTGGAGNGSNELVFEAAGESFGATLDNLRLVKVADAVLVNPGNVAPEAQTLDLTISQDVAFNGQVSASDANGDALVYSVGDGPANGTLVFNADGSYRYTPTAGFSGNDGFSYLVNDGHGGIVEANVNFNVAEGILLGTDLIVNGSFEDLSESSGNNGASDWGYRNQDGQIAGWTNVNNKRIEQHWDNYGGIVAKDGRIWIDMDHSQTGTTQDRIGQSLAHVEDGATYRVSFSLSDSDRINNDDGVTVLWNGEVLFDGLPPQTSGSWTTLSFDVVGGSGDGTNRLEFLDKGVSDSWGAGAALDDVHFVKVANVGESLPENQVPVAADSQAEGMNDTVFTGQLSATDQDDNAALIYSLATGPSHGTALVYTDGTYSYTPSNGFSGTDSFTYLVDDGRGGKDTATVSFNVKSDASTVAIGTDLIVNGSFEDVSESSNYNGGSDWGYRNNDKQIAGWTNVNRIEQHLDNYGGVVAKDGKFWIDLDSSNLTQRNKLGQDVANVETGAVYRVSFSLSDSDKGRNDDGVIVYWNGEIIFQGLAPQNTTGVNPAWETFSFEVVGGSGNGLNRLEFSDTGVSDSWGAGVALDDVHFVKIADEVAPNADPVAGDDSGFTTAYATALTLAAATLLANDTDANADALAIQSIGTGIGGTAVLDENGNIVFTPAEGFEGEASFTYVVSDGKGGTDTATVTITVDPQPEQAGEGTPGDDVLAGTSGDDVMLAGLGDDEVHGGAGNDTLDGEDGDDTLFGDEGNDLLKGGAGDDTLSGGQGDDVLVGGAGDDLLDGGEGIDTADYSDDTDGIVVDLAAGYAEGDAIGYDELASIENIVGGAGDDTLTGDDEANRLVGGLGADLLNGGAGNDVLDGGAGNDILNGGAGDDLILAGLGDDVIDGGAGFDTLDLSAATGKVTVDFAKGTVSGDGIGTDTFNNIERLLFGAGNDTVAGGNGDDAFDGGSGNDTLKGGAGDDQLWGGDGDDQLDGGSGHDALYGGNGNDTIKAGSGDDVIEAGNGNDVIDAGSGDDIIRAGAGDDIVDGGSGSDRIEGGEGNDTLTGGSGHDVFVFAAGFGRDIVTDFKTTGSSSDVLEFDHAVFADFDAAIAAAQQQGADTVFTVDADTSLTLKNVQIANLHADDFHFA